ncbi:hypothetical protein SynMVIR181_01884 [Synechococcus sp. MVIR-18-1]|nr:hypothetical protein SynMVIR181_01884 [Synechococcus sp. MVIR-18-1]
MASAGEHGASHNNATKQNESRERKAGEAVHPTQAPHTTECCQEGAF